MFVLTVAYFGPRRNSDLPIIIFVLFHRKRSPFSKGRRQCVSGKSRHSDAARNKDIKKQVKRAVVGGDSRHARQEQHKPWSDGVFLANTAFRSRVIYRV